MSKNRKSFFERAAEKVGLKKTYQVMVDLKINGRVVMKTGVVVSAIGSGNAAREAEKIALQNCPVTARANDSKVIKPEELNKLLNKIKSTEIHDF